MFFFTVSNLNESTQPSKDKTLPARGQKAKYQPLRNDVNLLLRDIKVEHSDPILVDRLRRRTNLSGKQDRKVKSKTEQRRTAATESTSKEEERGEGGSKNAYPCKICKKMFDTEFGRSVHVRSHKRCRGCKRIFPFPSTLKAHKPYCKQLKKLLAGEVDIISHEDEDETLAPDEKPAVNQKSTSSSQKNDHQGRKNGGRYSCAYCSKMFHYRFKIVEHMRIHTGEKPFSCRFCQTKFRLSQTLKMHMVRKHKSKMRKMETLDKTKERRADPASPSKRTSQGIKQNKRRHHSERSSNWQTMGIRHNLGFACLSCHKVLRNKSGLIEHYRIHTGERPLKCDTCPASFRFTAQLSKHKKRCNHAVAIIKCEKN